MNIFRWLFRLLFHCHHRDMSRVFTIDNRTYQVCFDCGRNFDYSWEQMHSEEPIVRGDSLQCGISQMQVCPFEYAARASQS